MSRLPQPSDEGAPVLNLAVGDVVVYASHGIGCVEAKRAAKGKLPETVVLAFESGLKVTLPVARAHGALRSPAGKLELEDVRRTLSAEAAPSAESWAKRFRVMQEKVTGGQVTGLAEVVRDGLQRERRSSSAPSERNLYLQARKLLAAEIALARGIDPAAAEVWIDEQIGDDAGAEGGRQSNRPSPRTRAR